MSYSGIRSALATRIAAVSGGPGVVHSRIRWSNENPDSSAFQTLFVSGGRINFAQITRKGRKVIRSVEDSRRRVQHEIEIVFVYGMEDADTTETLFQDMLEAVALNLETGDHTLGGACITHTEPEISDIGHEVRSDVLCHAATMRITVEEVLG